MSKASEWTRRIKDAKTELVRASDALPSVSAWNPDCLDWEAMASETGNVRLFFKRVQEGGCPQWQGEGAAIHMSPDHARILAHWILDTFEEKEGA